MRTSFKIVVALFLAVALVSGCAYTLGQKRATMGLADWYVTNHELLAAEWVNASPEHQQWLWENVLPYMNALKYGIIGLDAVGEDNPENMAFAANGLLNIAGVEYDLTRLAIAIQMRDYQTIQTEVLALKNLIIMKWLEKEE